jgi:hypothetical protein
MSTESTGLIGVLQDFVSQAPEWLAPGAVALAGAVPFVEGEGAAALGVIAGVHPIVAAIAGIIGNLVCVVAVVLVSARVRTAVTTRPGAAARGSSARREKFERAYHRYGTPGVSLLGPLLLPTQFTAAALTATGVPPAKVILWQGIAIVLWTTLLVLIVSGIISFVA